jgi:peptidoglycan/xylan/chitin deacetylase (PgdA/CDA1 family)
MIGVMYHYVRPETDRYPDYYHLNLNDFRRQLNYLEKEFGFVDYRDFIKCLNDRSNPVPEGVILTFDDGLRDHYESVYPELVKRDLWGIFYVPTKPIAHQELLDVHKLHILLGEIDPNSIYDKIDALVEDRMVPYNKREDFKNAYNSQNDTEVVKLIKRTFNFYLKEDYKSPILDELLDLFSISLEWNDYYMTPDELMEMKHNGMVIGPHTITHPVLSKLNKQEQLDEIGGSLEQLERRIGELKTKTFCYPFGSPRSFNEQTINILDNQGFDSAFIVESREITQIDVKNQYMMPRFDCNELPYGESSGGIN